MNYVDALNDALSAATTLFGVFAALAVIVTGFYLGRRWMKKAGYDGGYTIKDEYRSLRASGWTPEQIQAGGRTMNSDGTYRAGP